MDDTNKIKMTREEYRQYKKKRKMRLKPWAFCIFLLFFLTILIVSCYKIYSWNLDNKKIKNLTEDIDKSTKPIANTEEG